jgi:PAS domain S-box-containing protein
MAASEPRVEARMEGSEFRLSFLTDSRLAPLATSALPAWLWKADASGILWANPTGAAIFGALTSRALAERRFDSTDPAAAEISRMATTLPPGAPPRIERLAGPGAGVGPPLACACSHIVLPDHTPAILVVAAERAGPVLSLSERARRLLAGSEEPVAAFASDGGLLAASPRAETHLGSATSLAALGAHTLAAAAQASGHAAGSLAGGELTITRIGGETEPVLMARFGPPQSAVRPMAAVPEQARTTGEGTHEAAQPAPRAAARRHPLRFVWQMDEDGRFTLSSDEFVALMGPRTASAIGRSWRELAAMLELDPEEHVAHAVATRDTWSGVTVSWPIDDGSQRLAVELSALPVVDRERTFRGYRGFGVCRDLPLLAALAQARSGQNHPSSESVAVPAATSPRPPPPLPSPLTDAASVPAPALEDIVPSTNPSEPTIPALSPVEHSAFRELSRKLAQSLTARHDEGDPSLWPDGHQPVASATHPQNESVTDPRPLLDRLPLGILVYRFDHILYANPTFLKWSGHASLAQLMQAGGLDSLFIEGASAIGADDRGALRLSVGRGHNVSVAGEPIDIRWDGEAAHAIITAVADDAPAMLDGARAEAAELKSILDTATDGVIVLDAHGHILSGNRGAEALFGYDELAGRAFTALFAPESAAVAQQYLDDLTGGTASLPSPAKGVVETRERAGAGEGLARGQGGREVVGRVRQGGPIPLFMTMGRLGGSDEKLCAVFRDLTQWKEAERELVDAKRQAEQASSAKSDFLARISHEIRTPLNSIIGFSEVMMQERFGPLGNERYRAYLKDIHVSGEHLLSLINDLLDLSRIEAGKLDLTFISVALNDLAQQCVAIMQPQAARERIIMRSSLSHTLPKVLADARSVRQIILNLLSNSIKFTGAGGQVIISTALEDDGDVVLRVRDTGIGMSEQDIVTAMEPFRQLATAAHGRSAGTGLGLPLTKALAEANRARFQLKSAPKEGTLVEIAFPAAQVLAG